jgi:DNA-binding MarR family transcriptional regulator
MDYKYLLTLDKNMSLAQLAVLKAVYDEPFMNIAYYENESFQPRSTVSRYLIKLEKLGWITKKTNPHNKRKTTVNITRLGREIMKTSSRGEYNG